MNKLAQGRGNLVGQVESFRALGVEVKRPISPTLAEQAISEHEPEAADTLDEPLADDENTLQLSGSDPQPEENFPARE